jgi:hypothetical protein
MNYKIEDLRGKYVEVGTPECEVFLDACEELGIKWLLWGENPRGYKTSSAFICIWNDGEDTLSTQNSNCQSGNKELALFTPKQTWTVYNNDKPMSELSDEQAAELFNYCRNGGEVEILSGGNVWLLVVNSYHMIIAGTYRAKKKSERELFIEKGLAVYESDEVGGNVESLLGAMFDADFKAPKGGE